MIRSSIDRVNSLALVMGTLPGFDSCFSQEYLDLDRAVVIVTGAGRKRNREWEQRGSL